MLKNLSLILLFATAINCTAHKVDSLRLKPNSDLREEAYERARALFAIKENRSALSILEKIIASDPVDALTVDALVFASEIFLAEKNPERALSIMKDFEKRAKNRNLDESRLARVRSALSKAVVVENHVPVREPEPTPRPVMSPSIPVVERSIGVLLPLSETFEVYGKRALTAIQLAFGATKQQRLENALLLKDEKGLSVIVMDTKGSPQVARSAVDRLVNEFHVGVIIGDILADSAAAIAQQCQERGVVNLTLSRKEGLTAIGANVFRFAGTPAAQARELLSASNEPGEKKRYAVLYPENPFGIEMRDAFVAQAKALGLPVVKVQGYKPNETTFTEPIRKLVGPKITAGNLMFEECSEKANRIKDVAARKKAERDCFDAAVPNVNFDALFIPEFPKTLGYIVPALISEGVMVSQNDDMVRAYRRTSRISNAKPVQLLGPSSWNNDTIGSKLGNQVDGAIFVDSGDLLEDRELVKNFSESFSAASQSAPALTEALAFDAMNTAKLLLAREPGASLNVETIKHGIQRFEFEGVIGKIAFDQNRELLKPFRVFSFQEGKIIPRS